MFYTNNSTSQLRPAMFQMPDGLAWLVAPVLDSPDLASVPEAPPVLLPLGLYSQNSHKTTAGSCAI